MKRGISIRFRQPAGLQLHLPRVFDISEMFPTKGNISEKSGPEPLLIVYRLKCSFCLAKLTGLCKKITAGTLYYSLICFSRMLQQVFLAKLQCFFGVHQLTGLNEQISQSGIDHA